MHPAQRTIDPYYVPADYNEMVDLYGGYIRSLMRRFGVNYLYYDDMEQQLWLKILTRDLLSTYNGEGKFKNWVYLFVEGWAHFQPAGMKVARNWSYDEHPWLADRAKSEDPASVVVRNEEIREAKAKVQKLRAALDKIPATRYERYPANQTPQSERKTLASVLDAFFTEQEDERGTSWGHSKAGRRDEVIADILGVNRKTARQWELKMIEAARSVSL